MMKPVISLPYFFPLLLIIFGIGEGSINYGSLIGDVCDKYMTDSIIIVPTRSYFSLEKITILQKISKELSARGISSVVLNFMQLEEGMMFHSKTSRRLLVVIFMDEITEVHKFSEDIVNINGRHPLQLVLFTGDSNEDLCRYCRDPLGNPFKLKFNSEMLVHCCDSDSIEKWWSNRENETSKLPNGKWIGENKLDWYHNNTLYDHRQSMQHRGLRIAIVEGLFVRKENGQLRGYLGELLLELSRLMEFNISDIIVEDSYGNWDPKTSMWTGTMGTIIQGRADMGVAPVTMNAKRVGAVAFTIPVASAERTLFIRKPETFDVLWNACFKPLHGHIWIIISIFLLIVPLLLSIIKYKRKYNFFDMICEHYLNIWGIFCQKPLPDSPDGAPLRIVYISTYMMAIILYAAFSASFIRWITTRSLGLPFHTLTEFINDGTYELIMKIDDGEYTRLRLSNDTMSKKMLTLIKSRNSWPHSREEGFEQVCSQRKAFYNWNAYGIRYPCELTAIRVGGKAHFGMILPLNSEYTRTVNHYLQQLKYNGILRQLEDKFLRARNNTLDTSSDAYKPVTFKEVVPILIAFGIGFSIAFIIFCIEIPLMMKRLRNSQAAIILIL